MAPKPASTAGKAPSVASKTPVAGKKTPSSKAAGSGAAPAEGEKKKRRKIRKETYSSYIYKGIARFGLTLSFDH